MILTFPSYFCKSEYQKKSAELEKRVNIDLQAVVTNFESTRHNAEKAISGEWQTIHAGVTVLNPELEWSEFAQRSGHLVPEDIAMRDVEEIAFPGHNEEITTPINVGLLERKKRCKYRHNQKFSFYTYMLTMFLHTQSRSHSPLQRKLLCSYPVRLSA